MRVCKTRFPANVTNWFDLGGLRMFVSRGFNDESGGGWAFVVVGELG